MGDKKRAKKRERFPCLQLQIFLSSMIGSQSSFWEEGEKKQKKNPMLFLTFLPARQEAGPKLRRSYGNAQTPRPHLVGPLPFFLVDYNFAFF